MHNQSILILHSDIAENASPDEQDTLQQVTEIKEALITLGYSVDTLSFDIFAVKKIIEQNKPQIIFNLVESIENRGDKIYLIPSLLEHLNIAYTGCNSHALFTTSNKILTKRLLSAEKIPTPEWFESPELRNTHLLINENYIIKSVMEDGSLGIDKHSVANNRETLIEIFENREQRFGGTWFAERYIPGREFNLALIGDKKNPHILPIAEIKFLDFTADELAIVDYAAKWDSESKAYKNTPGCFDFDSSDDGLLEHLKKLAIKCWNCFDLSGYARVDFRVDDQGNPWVLEVNANPCLSKDAGFVAAGEKANMSYESLIKNILEKVQ